MSSQRLELREGHFRFEGYYLVGLRSTEYNGGFLLFGDFVESIVREDICRLSLEKKFSFYPSCDSMLVIYWWVSGFRLAVTAVTGPILRGIR